MNKPTYDELAAQNQKLREAISELARKWDSPDMSGKPIADAVNKLRRLAALVDMRATAAIEAEVWSAAQELARSTYANGGTVWDIDTALGQRAEQAKAWAVRDQ